VAIVLITFLTSNFRDTKVAILQPLFRVFGYDAMKMLDRGRNGGCAENRFGPCLAIATASVPGVLSKLSG
tara:strand:- start:680 stop:889 length:210 start_codon:yes stop_codon:yes gene_type:complete